MFKTLCVWWVAAAMAATVAAQPVNVAPAPPVAEIMPSIRVTSPSASLTAFVGGQLVVTWRTVGRVPARVDVSLHPPGCTGTGTLLLAATANDGSATVYIPGTMADGYYSVRVGQFGSTLFGCSDRFHIRFDYGVTEPARATIWHPGAAAVVRWRSPRSGGVAVDLMLLGEHGFFGPCLARSTANDGEQRVTVPADLPAGFYRIMLHPGCCAGYDRGLGSFSEFFRLEAR